MIKKQIIDVTGIPLTPSWQGKRCLGNGEYQEYECCCDECDYYLRCFPQYNYMFKRKKRKKQSRLVGSICVNRHYEVFKRCH